MTTHTIHRTTTSEEDTRMNSTITATRSTDVTLSTARLAIILDPMSEPVPATGDTLTTLLERDDVLFDPWVDGEAEVAIIGPDAAVTMLADDLDMTFEYVEHRLRQGLGFEGPVPLEVSVARYDERSPVEADGTARCFREPLRESVADWRLIENALYGIEA